MTSSKWIKFMDWHKKEMQPLKGYITLYPEAKKFIQNLSSSSTLEIMKNCDISVYPNKMVYDNNNVYVIQHLDGKRTMRAVIPFNFIKKLRISNYNL